MLLLVGDRINNRGALGGSVSLKCLLFFQHILLITRYVYVYVEITFITIRCSENYKSNTLHAAPLLTDTEIRSDVHKNKCELRVAGIDFNLF